MSAMGSMSTAISQSVTQALAVQPPHASRTTENDGNVPSTDNALRSRKRACPRQAERARGWKSARSQPERVSDSDRESDEEAQRYSLHGSEEDLTGVAVDPVDVDLPPPPTAAFPDAPSGSADPLLDPLGDPMFDPNALHHPRSSEWLPATHVAQYIESMARKPLTKEARTKLRAECPRPLIPHKVCETPVVDPKMVQFLTKTGFNPRKGLDSALRACQDKVLDIMGPLAKILDMAEAARAAGSQVDPEELTGWAQRAVCLTGNANTSLAIERRKALLMKIEPKLANLAISEAGKDAQGLLFGEPFIKELGKYVGAFTALDKAQASMRKVFPNRFSARAGSFRGRLPGRSSSYARGSGRGSFGHRSSLQDQQHQPSFFPTRGGYNRGRGFRGHPGSRKPYG
ncbi:uncharacterized protein LOC122944062 [Bufo gargarizans]|nr:uncharacterized protein LOC122944062 [Bufo gargarizans]